MDVLAQMCFGKCPILWEICAQVSSSLPSPLNYILKLIDQCQKRKEKNPDKFFFGTCRNETFQPV